jgi:hypothetical protein
MITTKHSVKHANLKSSLIERFSGLFLNRDTNPNLYNLIISMKGGPNGLTA